MDQMNQNQPEVKKGGNRILTAVVLLILVALAFVAFGGMKDKDDLNNNDIMKDNSGEMMDEEKDAMMEKDSNVMMQSEVGKTGDSMMSSDTDAMMTKSGSYEMYSPEKLAMAEKGKVVIFFKASWCPTCRALDADIKANMKNIPEGLTILELDYDKSNDLKKKYEVTTQHTLVQVDVDGNLISKWTGSPNLTELAAKVQ